MKLKETQRTNRKVHPIPGAKKRVTGATRVKMRGKKFYLFLIGQESISFI